MSDGQLAMTIAAAVVGGVVGHLLRMWVGRFMERRRGWLR